MSNSYQIAIVGIFIAAVSAKAAAADPTYTQHQDVVYAQTDGVALVMDIFTPTGRSNGLGIIDVASGAWHSDRGKIRDHERGQVFQIFCGKGYTVFAVRPGSITKFSAPEMLAHINEGIRWVKSHAGEYKIDPDRLGLMGASAGGHLASLAAVTAHDSEPGRPRPGPEKNDSTQDSSISNTTVKAVAVFFPPTDFLDFGGKPADVHSPNGIGEIVRKLAFPAGIENLSDAEIEDHLKQISPARLVTSHTPPFLLIHGDADPVVPLQQSERLLEELKKAGVPAELVVKKGGGHPWPTLHEEVQVMADWFDKQLENK